MASLPYGIIANRKDGLLDQVQKRHPNLPGPCATRYSWFQVFFYGPTGGHIVFYDRHTVKQIVLAAHKD